MQPSKFTVYTLKSSSEEFSYCGTADVLKDGEEPREVHLLVRIMSGYDKAQWQRTAAGKTNFIICDLEDFETLFEEKPGLGELTPAAQARRDTE